MATNKKNTGSKIRFYLNILLGILLIGGGLWNAWKTAQNIGDTTPNPTIDVSSQEMVAPEFSLTALAGQTVSLSDYAGQVVLLNFWATWCPPCVAELPTLDAFYRDHRAEGVALFAINAEENRADIEAFVQANGLTLPVLMDADGTVMHRYDVRAMPVSVIIDRDGLIRFIHRGEITREQLNSLVLPLLNSD